MGHVRLAGYVTEEEHFGAKVGRVDIYGKDGKVVTQFFGGRVNAKTDTSLRRADRELGAYQGEPCGRK